MQKQHDPIIRVAFSEVIEQPLASVIVQVYVPIVKPVAV